MLVTTLPKDNFAWHIILLANSEMTGRFGRHLSPQAATSGLESEWAILLGYIKI